MAWCATQLPISELRHSSPVTGSVICWWLKLNFSIGVVVQLLSLVQLWDPMDWREMFFWSSLAFSMIQWMLAIWSVVPLPFPNPACTSGSSQFTYYWSLPWRILSRTLITMWNECNCTVVLWNCSSLGLEWKLSFSSPLAITEFSKFADLLSEAFSQHHLLGFEIAQLEFCHLP